MNLKLNRPLVFFDLETTGINIAKDRIVEISLLKVYPNGNKEMITRRVNPEMSIPPEATAVHGISDKDVINEPTFKQLADDLYDFIKDCDLAGYNSNNFDIPLLAEEFLRAGIDIDFSQVKKIDVQVVFHKKEPRNLAAAYKFYCNKELENAHSAQADVTATYEILNKQVEIYDDLQPDIDFLEKFTTHKNKADLSGRFVFNSQGDIVFNFGKHKGKPVAEVLKKEPSYYAWMMQGDFPQYTKKVLQKIKETV
ncbi:MAG: 3'-5' exonuclease [Bacteroidetes bacterium]|nr:MAG: 3'-5' exonuclease [Bacteroidota bacterium]